MGGGGGGTGVGGRRALGSETERVHSLGVDGLIASSQHHESHLNPPLLSIRGSRHEYTMDPIVTIPLPTLPPYPLLLFSYPSVSPTL